MYQTAIISTNCVCPSVLPWREIFEDLKDAGIRPTHVAVMLGKGWSSIQPWVYGEIEPRDSCARAILALHTHYCGEDKTAERQGQALLLDP